MVSSSSWQQLAAVRTLARWLVWRAVVVVGRERGWKGAEPPSQREHADKVSRKEVVTLSAG